MVADGTTGGLLLSVETLVVKTNHGGLLLLQNTCIEKYRNIHDRKKIEYINEDVSQHRECAMLILRPASCIHPGCLSQAGCELGTTLLAGGGGGRAGAFGTFRTLS